MKIAPPGTGNCSVTIFAPDAPTHIDTFIPPGDLEVICRHPRKNRWGTPNRTPSVYSSKSKKHA